jgi:hypothetical protein
MSRRKPTPGNIMSEPISGLNTPPPSAMRQAALDAGIERLSNAGNEAVGAIKDIVKARPVAAACVVLGLGYLYGVARRKRRR